MRKKRLDLVLFQKYVAKMLDVGKPSIHNGKNNLAEPAIKYIPKIIKFLVDMPNGTSTKSVGEKIVLYRKVPDQF